MQILSPLKITYSRSPQRPGGSENSVHPVNPVKKTRNQRQSLLRALRDFVLKKYRSFPRTPANLFKKRADRLRLIRILPPDRPDRNTRQAPEIEHRDNLPVMGAQDHLRDDGQPDPRRDVLLDDLKAPTVHDRLRLKVIPLKVDLQQPAGPRGLREKDKGLTP